MNIGIENIITWVGMAVGLIGIWFRNQFKLERLEEKLSDHVVNTSKMHDEYNRQIEAIWKWKDEYEKDTNSYRDGLNRSIGDLRGSISVNSEQFKQVISILTEIKERLKRLENLK